jgi:hypothetical protein
MGKGNNSQKKEVKKPKKEKPKVLAPGMTNYGPPGARRLRGTGDAGAALGRATWRPITFWC